jgi:hypothetical protein
MMYARILAICTIGIVCSTHALEGQGLSNYRNFEVGSDVASVATLAGVSSSEVKTIHQRPALLQDLEWRPSRWANGSTAASTDPVDQILFSFYDDQLFRVVVDYGQDRTEGMIGQDMIEAISAVYGTPLGRTYRASRPGSRLETQSGSPLARWGDSEHAIVLYQTSSYRPAYRLIVTDIRLDDLARKAESQSVRLDDQEAPAREIARQKKERDDQRAAAAKARVANKGAFRP